MIENNTASNLLTDALPSHKLTDHDELLINLFWQPNFDEKWVKLDETFLEEWVLPGSSLNVNSLYHTILFPNFHQNVDYRLCDEGDCLYMVTGYCLKQLCIMCSRSFQRFFIRTDRAAQMLALTKIVEKNRHQITFNKLLHRIDELNRKMDELSYIINEKMDLKKDIEVFKLFRVEKAHYVFIRSLKKNQDKRTVEGEPMLDEPIELDRDHMKQLVERIKTSFRVKDNHIFLRPKQTENDLVTLITTP